MLLKRLLFISLALSFTTSPIHAQDCSVPFVPSQFKARLAWQSAQDAPASLATPVVTNMNPQADSMPEIIVAEAAASGVSNKIQFYRGDGSNADNPMILTVPGSFDNYPVPGPTVGDVNGDGIPELLMSCNDRKIRVFHNYTENLTAPMQLWITAIGNLDDVDQRPLLADFDGDGIPEVYAGSDIYKFDFSNPAAPTLTKVINGLSNKGQAHYNNYGEGSCNPTAVDILSVADCGGDPDCAGLELVAGPVIYSIDLNNADGDGYQIKVQRDLNTLVPPPAGYKDGYTAVADMDLDGILDVIVTSRRANNQTGAYVWNKTGLKRFFPYPTNAANSGSLACVANVYDDTKAGYAKDFPEIIVCSSYNLTCFNMQAAITNPAAPFWWNLPTTDYSGWTGSSVYDFNGDGFSEIVYRDERDFRIMYGGPAPFPPGVDAERNWHKISSWSPTSDEYPVVADVDNDGETEVVLTGRITGGVFFNSRGRLRVFESDAEPWVPCRNVWNQYNYFIVNVNDDLSIPDQLQKHHLELPAAGSGNRPFNRYLSQLPVLNSNYETFIPLPDADAQVVKVECRLDSQIITLNICNTGDQTLHPNIPIAFYAADPTAISAALLGTIQLTNAAVKKDSCKLFQFTIPKISGDIYGVINDDGSTPAPFQLGADFPVTNTLECNWLNNIFQFQGPGATPNLNLGPDYGYCFDTLLVLDAGTAFVGYQWQDGSTGSVFQAQQAGLFWVEATDFCAQKHLDSVLIVLFDLPAIQLDTINGDCFGNPASVTALANGAYSPFGYQWSTGDNTASLPNLTDGLYAVTVTNAKGCTATQETWVEAGGNLQALASVTAPILCFGETGALQVDFVVGKAPFAFNWSDGSANPSLPNVPAGDYAVTVTDADLCVQTLQVSLGQPEPLISSGLSHLPACPGEANAAASFLGAAQGTAPYALLWSNGANSNTISGIVAGTYQLTLSDANACSLVETVIVPEFQAPIVQGNPSSVSCFGQADGSISLNITGGAPSLNYSWSNGSSTQDIDNLGPGNYSLTLSYANGTCTQTFDYQITEQSPVAVTAASTQPKCAGDATGTIQLQASGGVSPFQYNWSTGDNLAALGGLTTGLYTATVTDAAACTEVLTLSLEEPLPLASAGIQAVSACPDAANGSAAFLGASQGTPPYTLLWSNNAATPNLDNITAGNYQLSITDAHGCALVESVSVPAYLAPVTANVTVDVSCFGGNDGGVFVSILSGSPGYGFLWLNGETSAKIENLPVGNYALTLTYADGVCTQTHGYQVNEPTPIILIDSLLTPVRCFGAATGAIALSNNGGTPPYQYQWASGQQTQSIANLAAGDYTLTITDAKGCPYLASFLLPQPNQLASSAIVQADTCHSSSGVISSSGSGGVPPYQFAWSNTANSPAITGLSAGSYALTLTDANGCTHTMPAQVPAYGAQPIITPITDVITCAHPSAAIGVSANQNNLHFNWSAPNGTLPDQALHSVQQSGLYQVTVSNQFGCQSTAQLQVLEDVAHPVAEAGGPDVRVPCSETELLLSAAGSTQGAGFLNHWQRLLNGVPVFDTLAINMRIFEPGLYVHSVLNTVNGCADLDSILVAWDPPINASLTVDPIVCFGEKGTIRIQYLSGGTPPFHYSIDDQNFTVQNNFYGLTPGNYPITLHDDHDCWWESNVELTSPSQISVALTASDTSLELGQFVLLKALPNPQNIELSDITWGPNDIHFEPMSLQQRQKPETNTEFSVRIVDKDGCIAEDRLWVNVYNHNIYIPNIIHPGSADNSWFTVYGGGAVKEVRLLRVYSRWGELLFERRGFPLNEPTLGWDGSFRGLGVNPGVFAWYADVELHDGRVLGFKGDVTVVR